MKNLIFLIISIFLSGCAFRFQGREKTFLDIDYREEYIKNNPDLKEEWKETIIKGEIPLGIEKKDVEKILGKNYSIYISKTGLMELWIYDKYYVGFDKNGKVIKFRIFEKEEEDIK